MRYGRKSAPWICGTPAIHGGRRRCSCRDGHSTIAAMKAWGIASLVAVLVAGCQASDPEAEIRALLASAEEAAEARDVGFFGEILSDSYRDAHGNDREETLRMLRGLFIANQRIEIASRVDEIVIEGGDAARAVVHAGMVGRRTNAGLID